ncbi:ATP-binding protein [Thermotoga sp. Ku-13t]|uniref:ATP-binding protein n=1 Tax=Thermotoga sp. Ku-13t TaxID=1755813 RepID=UPI001F49A63F|nr:ATP-binding protein [Thermotoga sp. Ku-13t]
MKDWFMATFNSNPLSTKVARGIVKSFLMQHAVPEEDVWDLEIAVNEALTNVIRHTYRNEHDKIIKLSIFWNEGEVEIFIRDYGEHVDPRSLKPKPPDPEREGGFGLYIIHRVFDSVQFLNVYRGNLLILKKRLRGRLP